jgi:phosphopentomutase
MSEGEWLGDRETFADVGATLAEWFRIAPLSSGESFLNKLALRP